MYMKFARRIASLLVTLVLIGAILITWFAREDIYDWWVLRNYTPPQEVASLADETTMTSHARRIFYVNHPDIAQASQFNQACSQETSIVIGCYIPGKGIYIFNITDQRLAGVKQVTAAHEMLHAAYDRLSLSEQRHVDALTEAEYDKLTNQRIKDNVEKYRSQDPSVVSNELHSILATEVSDLSPELENYYKQYFTDRQAVVRYSNHYEAEFTNRQQQVANYDKQLAELKGSIDAGKNELNLQLNALKAEKNRLDSLISQNRIAEYNNAVPGFNANVGSYNVLVHKVDNDINTYNQIVQSRNNIAGEMQDLANSIDSRPQSF